MYLTEEQFKALSQASLHGITGAKQCARKKGFHGGMPLNTDELHGVCNGHVVEVAFCHLLGVTQRYVNYTFNVIITKELDCDGYDIVIETKLHGVKKVQIKHTYRIGAREWESGTYVLSTIRSGSETIRHFMEYYNIPLTVKKDKDIRKMFLELDYMWDLYMLDINEVYAKRF